MREHLLRFDKSKTYVFIDCETFNLCLNSVYNLPWQIAMIKAVAGKKVAEKNFYIKWDTDLKIGAEAARITRYSQKTMDEKGISPEEVFPTVYDWLDNADWIVAHNMLGFDLYLIRDYYRLNGVDYKYLLPKILDTNSLARGIKLGIPYKEDEGSLIEYQYRMTNTRKKGVRTSLIAMGKGYDIEHDYDKLHNAIVDLELNLKVWNKIKWQIEV
jgi:DNA polymerase III epsilon subunit-like protein